MVETVTTKASKTLKANEVTEVQIHVTEAHDGVENTMAVETAGPKSEIQEVETSKDANVDDPAAAKSVVGNVEGLSAVETATKVVEYHVEVETDRENVSISGEVPILPESESTEPMVIDALIDSETEHYKKFDL